MQFGSVAGTLIVNPGAVFGGDIVGNQVVADTLVLAGYSLGTFSGLGTTVVVLNDISIRVGANWQIDGTVSGTGALKLSPGASLTVVGTVNIASVLFYGSGGETLRLADPAQFGSVFSGFGTGDVIDLQGVNATSVDYSQDTLSLYNHGTIVDALSFAGTTVTRTFHCNRMVTGRTFPTRAQWPILCHMGSLRPTNTRDMR